MAEGIPIHQTVSPFARRHPIFGSWPGRTRAGISNLANNRTGDQGCPKRHEEGTCEIVRETRLAFSRALRPATCVVQVRGSLVSARKRVAANATGIGWCRQFACEDRAARSGVPARRIQGCRKSASVAEAREKRVPGGNGAREHEPGQRVRKATLVKRRRQPGSRWRNRVSGEGSSQGARKGIAGQRSLSTGRHLGPLSHRYRFTRPVGAASAATAKATSA